MGVVSFSRAAHDALTADARRTRQTPERFLERALRRALAEHADQEIDRLDQAVRELLTHTTSAYIHGWGRGTCADTTQRAAPRIP
jgi:hypothetical protein